jgi:very-short-patch-repair endonuclease
MLRCLHDRAEKKLWGSPAAGRRFDGAKFRMQVWIGPTSSIFYCYEARVIVELDGSAAWRSAIDYDRAAAMLELEQEGYRVTQILEQ